MTSRRTTFVIVLLSLVAIASCSAPGGKVATDEGPPEIRDLEQILATKQLRILLPRRTTISHLPRSGQPLGFERELAEAFAASLGVEAVPVVVESRDRLIPDLLAGRGDVIAANLTATRDRKKKVVFTVPVAVVREQLVTRTDDTSIASEADLAGRTIAARRSSSFWKTLDRLHDRQPQVKIREADENLETEELIHRVATGDLDLTIADSNLVEACLEYRDDIRPALDLTRDRPIAMAVRPGASELLASLNRYLVEAQLTDRSDQLHVEDLDGIKKRRVLRMITRNMAATYFLWRGQLMGFEYDLVKEFAKQEGLRLEVIVPPTGEEMLDWLREGRGDMVAAALTPTEERARDGVVFTRPYNYVRHLVVQRKGETGLDGPEDLAGRKVYVRPSSVYQKTLEELRQAGVDVEIVPVPENIETEEIIDRVARGEYDLTLADSHILQIELNWRDDVEAAFALSDELPLAWAVRESNPGLGAALNDFLDREYRGLYYNIIYQRYFEDPTKIARHRRERTDLVGGLSPYDEIVRRYAEQYGFDWRLIASMMFQESRFNPRASSFAGARGLMQVLPNTAEELGFDDLSDPDESIHAGVKYLDWVRERFEPELSVQDRTWFTLAAYNAGAGHVNDARRLAARLELNPNRWFGNVERAMLLLSKPEYAEQARYGYCRCSEPVRYVRDVRARYNAYVETLASSL